MSTPKKILDTFSIIHFAMLAGPTVAGVIFYFTTSVSNTSEFNQEDIFVYLLPIIAMAGIFVGKFLYPKLLIPVKKKETLQQKLAGFQTASLIQYALVEGPALINIVWFSITGNLLYLTIGGVLIIYLFTLRPTKDKVELDLELQGEHKSQFNKLETPLTDE